LFNYLLIDNLPNNWFKLLFLKSLTRTEMLYTKERTYTPHTG